MTDDLRLPFDPRFDVWVNPPDPTVGGPPLHEFAADKDPEEVRLVRLVAQTGGVRGAAHRGAARGRRAGRPWRGADRSVTGRRTRGRLRAGPPDCVGPVRHDGAREHGPARTRECHV